MRLPDWEDRLGEFLAGVQGAAFAWGSNDCVTLAAGAVAALTGEDPLQGLPRNYRTQAGAMKALAKAGFADLRAAVDSKLAPVPLAFAGRGDVVMQDANLGVVIGREALFWGDEGLERRPVLGCDAAWKVGDRG